MKNRFFRLFGQSIFLNTLLTLVFAQTSFAEGQSSWQDLGVDDVVSLTQTLSLPERGGASTVTLEKGESFQLFDIIALPGLTVALLRFQPETCAHADFISELELVLPEGSSSRGPLGEEVGVSYGPDCILETYIEAKDLGRPSFFLLQGGDFR